MRWIILWIILQIILREMTAADISLNICSTERITTAPIWRIQSVSFFLIRQGINLIQILSDAEKREAAKSLAAVITGIIGIAPLVEVMTCFIMTVWAMGEALEDVRCLMAGGNVPLWKSADEWKIVTGRAFKYGNGQNGR